MTLKTLVYLDKRGILTRRVGGLLTVTKKVRAPLRQKMLISSAWRIQDFSDGVLKVRPDTKRGGGGVGGGGGGGGGVLFVSGPIQKVGRGGGSTVGFWPDTKGGGGEGMIAYRGARDIVQ